MNDQMLKEYYEIYTNAWKFFRKYATVPDDQKTDVYWEQVIDELHQICKLHPNQSSLVTKLYTATLLELEELSQEKGKKENDET